MRTRALVIVSACSLVVSTMTALPAAAAPDVSAAAVTRLPTR